MYKDYSCFMKFKWLNIRFQSWWLNFLTRMVILEKTSRLKGSKLVKLNIRFKGERTSISYY